MQLDVLLRCPESFSCACGSCGRKSLELSRARPRRPARQPWTFDQRRMLYRVLFRNVLLVFGTEVRVNLHYIPW